MNKAILTIDIGTTEVICVIAQNDLNNKINILGIGKSQSNGIKKGAIVDIDKASYCIKEAVDLSKSSSNISSFSTFVSLSAIHTNSKRSKGFINIPSGHITKKEIKQVLTMALFDASIVPDYEVIHVIPLYFKVDDNNTIDNPLNMNGTRLEVYANIITAKKTSINNIQQALKKSNLDVTNFVLRSYASILSTTSEDQKKSGTAVINLGASTSELGIFKNKSLLFNDVVQFGSESITNDLSIMLNTPISAANEVKKSYANLLGKNTNDENTITKVKVPVLSNPKESQEISLDLIQPMVHARVEEILSLVYTKLQQSQLKENINGLVITGGMSQIPGIDLLAQKVFGNLPVTLSTPQNIQNGYINFEDPTLSTTVGLLLYALDDDGFFELNFQKELRISPSVEKDIIEPKIVQPVISKNIQEHEEDHQIDNLESLQSIEKKHNESEKSVFSSIWKKIGELL